MSVRVETGQGACGHALSLSGEVLALHLDRPFAPGAPIDLSLHAGEGAPASLRVKTIDSKRRQDGSFDVRTRGVSIPRETRARLEASLA